MTTDTPKLLSNLGYMSTPERPCGNVGFKTERSPLHRPSVASVAASTLRREILDGKHFSGEQLRETQLATRLGVSRNTIRQAYRTLEMEGLLTHKPHHGVFVASFNLQRIEELYAFRRSAECGAILSLDGPRARHLGSHLTEILQDGSRTLAERNNAFHLSIAAASQSPELFNTAESIQAQLRLCFLSCPEAEGLHMRFAEHHWPIAQALSSSQIARATKLLQAYHADSFDAVTKALGLRDA